MSHYTDIDMDSSPPIPEPPLVAPQAPAMSLAARLMNIFATPGEVAEDIRRSRPSTANWLVPSLLYGLIGAISVILTLSQPTMIEQIRAQQTKPIEAKVAAGKMTRTQGDQAIAMMEKYSTPAVMKTFGSMGAIAMGFASVFFWAFLMWLIARFGLKVPINFMKTAEVAGLASMITSLEILMKTLLVFGFNNPLASTSLAMLLKNPDPQNKVFLALSVLNIMTFWVLVVRSIGLSKLTGVPFGKVGVWVFGTWALYMTLLMGLSGGLQSMFGG
jgi:hypothetical protein